jgi:hypothetical protein
MLSYHERGQQQIKGVLTRPVHQTVSDFDGILVLSLRSKRHPCHGLRVKDDGRLGTLESSGPDFTILVFEKVHDCIHERRSRTQPCRSESVFANHEQLQVVGTIPSFSNPADY